MPEVAIEDVLLRSYQDEDWQDVQNFIKKYWRENHPMCQKSLFDWQHKGSSTYHCMVAKQHGNIVGVHGVIPLSHFDKKLTKNQIFLAVTTGALIGLMWLTSVTFSIDAIAKMDWQPIAAYFIGGMIGTYYAMKIKQK